MPGSPALKLGRALDRTTAKIFMMGHLHDKIAVAKATEEFGQNGEIRSVERKAFMVPSYQGLAPVEDTSDDLGIPAVQWAQTKGFPPKPQGMMRFLVIPAEREFYGLF